MVEQMNKVIEAGDVVKLIEANKEYGLEAGTELLVTYISDNEDTQIIEVIGLDGELIDLSESEIKFEIVASTNIEEPKILNSMTVALKSDVDYDLHWNHGLPTVDVIADHEMLETQWEGCLEDARDAYGFEMEDVDNVKFVKIATTCDCDACYDSDVVPASYVEAVTHVPTKELEQLKAKAARLKVLETYLSNENFIETLKNDSNSSLSALLYSLITD